MALPDRLFWLDDQRRRHQGPLRGACASPGRATAAAVRGERGADGRLRRGGRGLAGNRDCA
jgi:hypothetical protein